MEVRIRKGRIALAVVENRRRTKEKAVFYKGGKCQQCEYDKCIAALEFHHRDPAAKEFRLSSGKTRNWDKVQKELDKCDLLCANCHREVHDAWKAASREAQRLALEEFKRRPSVPVKCSHCGKPMTVSAAKAETQQFFYCSTICSRRGHERTSWPSDIRLASLVWKKPITALAEEFGVSDRAIQKRCTRRGIKTPGPGYWAKVRAA